MREVGNLACAPGQERALRPACMPRAMDGGFDLSAAPKRVKVCVNFYACDCDDAGVCHDEP